MQTIDDLNYTLANAVYAMRKGFTIRTVYGNLAIPAEDAEPFIALATTYVNSKLDALYQEVQP